MLHSAQCLFLLLVPCTVIFLVLSEKASRRDSSRQNTPTDAWPRRHQTTFEQARTDQQNFAEDDAVVEGGSRITQVTMQFGDPYDVTIERALRTHIDHGEKWKHPTHLVRENILAVEDPEKKPFNKLWALMKVMLTEMTKPRERRSDWLVWFDSDTIIINPNVPWTIFLPPSESYFTDINLLVTTDWFGFNAGVMLIRVCEWSLTLLSDAIALRRLKPEVELGFFEQTALQIVFDQDERIDNRLYVPRHWFNVYDDKNAPPDEITYPGSMLVHFPALDHLEPIGHFLDQLEREPEKLQLPLGNTAYSAETEAYWARVYDAMRHLDDSQQYRNQIQILNSSLYETRQDVFDKIRDVEGALREVLRKSAFNKQEMRERTLELGQEIHFLHEIMEGGSEEAKGKEAGPPVGEAEEPRRWRDDEEGSRVTASGKSTSESPPDPESELT